VEYREALSYSVYLMSLKTETGKKFSSCGSMQSFSYHNVHEQLNWLWLCKAIQKYASNLECKVIE